jgi:hypothetical protein
VIVKHIEALREVFEPLGVSAPETTKKFETEKKHIYNCLNLPEVCTPFLYYNFDSK